MKTQAEDSQDCGKSLRKKTKVFKYFDPRECIICGDTYQPEGAHQKYCVYCKANNVGRFRVKKYKLGTCTSCGCKIPGRSRWCKDVLCQDHKLEYYKIAKVQYNERQRAAVEKRKHELKSIKNVNRDQRIIKYKCQRCHSDAYPNRRYCPTCFTYLSNKVDATGHSVSF